MNFYESIMSKSSTSESIKFAWIKFNSESHWPNEFIKILLRETAKKKIEERSLRITWIREKLGRERGKCGGDKGRERKIL